ncbi:MAG: PAS domain-containing sensor histidine kinase [Cyclobacteriaceae bacterium]|nr:PAS domain-containing sensor histidine kinase [Cyclobacteriaceae bacterium]
MASFRDFLVGKTDIPSRTDFKYAMLRSQFAAITLFVAAFYIVLDTINGVRVFIPFYLVLAAGGLVSFLLNRYRFFVAASITQMLLINGLVLIFSDVDHPYGGVYFYFLTCSAAGLILFSYYNRALSIVFALLPLVLGLVAFYSDLNVIPAPSYEPHMVEINFVSNLVIGILANGFVVYFLINRNREIEQSLLETSHDLKKSEERFLMALHGTKAGVYEWRMAENSIYVSTDWKLLLGYEAHELNYLTREDFLPWVYEEDRIRTRELIAANLAAQTPYQNQFRLRTKSGEYKWFQDSGVFKKDETGNVILVGTLIDIDSRKRAEEELALKNQQLAKTNEELDRFVYSASHDMRAPLSSLLGLIHLSEKTDRPEEVGLFLQMMKDRIKTMEGFIKEVTDYSRNTRLDLLPTPIKLATLAHEVVQTLAYSVVNKKVRIEVQIDPALEISTDPSRLKVVINNLVSNAYKYHRFDQPDPFILIDALKKADHVLLSIKDNGKGIGPEHHTRIFDMFYRASESSEGSGLGLYIVKETLDKLEGSISVQSTVGVGSEFLVTLPLSL